MPETTDRATEREKIKAKLKKTFAKLSETGDLRTEDAETDALDEKVQAMHDALDGYDFRDEIAVVASQMVATANDAKQFARELVSARDQIDGRVTLTRKTDTSLDQEAKEEAALFDGADREKLRSLAKSLKASTKVEQKLQTTFGSESSTETFGDRLEAIRSEVTRSNESSTIDPAQAEELLDDDQVYKPDDTGKRLTAKHVDQAQQMRFDFAEAGTNNDQSTSERSTESANADRSESEADHTSTTTETERESDTKDSTYAETDPATATDRDNETENGTYAKDGPTTSTGRTDEQEAGQKNEQDQSEQTDKADDKTVKEQLESEEIDTNEFETFADEVDYRCVMFAMTGASDVEEGFKDAINALDVDGDARAPTEIVRGVLVDGGYISDERFDELLQSVETLEKNRYILQDMRIDEDIALSEKFKAGLRSGHSSDTLMQVAYEEQIADKDAIWEALDLAQEAVSDESWWDWTKRIAKTGAASGVVGPGKDYLYNAFFGEEARFKDQDAQTRRELIGIAQGINDDKLDGATNIASEPGEIDHKSLTDITGGKSEELADIQDGFDDSTNFDFEQGDIKVGDLSGALDDISVHELTKQLEEDEQAVRTFLKEEAPELSEQQIEEFARRLHRIDPEQRRQVAENLAKFGIASGSTAAGGYAGMTLSAIIGGGMAGGFGLGIIGGMAGYYSGKKGVKYLSKRWAEKKKDVLKYEKDLPLFYDNEDEALARLKNELSTKESIKINIKTAAVTATSALGDGLGFIKDMFTSSREREETYEAIKDEISNLKEAYDEMDAQQIAEFIGALFFGSAAGMTVGQVVDPEDIYESVVEADNATSTPTAVGSFQSLQEAADAVRDNQAAEQTGPEAANASSRAEAVNQATVDQVNEAGGSTDAEEVDQTNDTNSSEQASDTNTDENQTAPWEENEELTEKEYRTIARTIGDPDNLSESRTRFAEAMVQHGENDARAFLQETTDLSDSGIDQQIELFQDSLRNQIADEAMTSISSTLQEEGSPRANVREAFLNHDRETVEKVLIANGSSVEQAESLIDNIENSPEYQAEAVLGPDSVDAATYTYFEAGYDSWEDAYNNEPGQFERAFQRLQMQTDAPIDRADVALVEGENGRTYLAKSH